MKQAPNAPLELSKQVLIILAAAYGFITPFIKDFKKNLTVVTLYEKALFAFVDAGNVHDYFEPIFKLYALADKEDFVFITNPLIYVLNYFHFIFHEHLK